MTATPEQIVAGNIVPGTTGQVLQTSAGAANWVNLDTTSIVGTVTNGAILWNGAAWLNALIKAANLDSSLTLDTIPKAAADVDLNTHKLLNVVDPTSAQHAATKNYVDGKVGGFATQSVSAGATLVAGSAPAVLTDTTSAAFTLNLPASPTTGGYFIIIDDTGQWNTHNLTIGRNGKNIDGAASNLTLVNQWGKVWLYYDGTAWWTLTAGASNETPIIDGTASAGTHMSYSRADHVHPTDTTRAPLASPTFTGTPAAPTAAQGTNTTQLATTAMVHSEVVLLAPLASPTFTGTPAAPTAAVDTNTTQLATTAMVLAQAASATPLIDGTATVGTSTRFARGDHIHPTDTSRAPTASPTLTGTVTIPTVAGSTDSSTKAASTAFVQAVVAALARPYISTRWYTMDGAKTTTALASGTVCKLFAQPIPAWMWGKTCTGLALNCTAAAVIGAGTAASATWRLAICPDDGTGKPSTSITTGTEVSGDATVAAAVRSGTFSGQTIPANGWFLFVTETPTAGNALGTLGTYPTYDTLTGAVPGVGSSSATTGIVNGYSESGQTTITSTLASLTIPTTNTGISTAFRIQAQLT